ncbi:hypothetical protein DI270_000530 [Microbispora triticiradicis]|uniref:Secreted protein n=1 Tax=Microbispora triticiradicis TaxID=2200763 RepID=A0ABX9LSK5_9ACTN|nr:hypothetical protein [Microbispora triticiradicis]RGA06983.1 hypothetical protein DI270_000530 [Microbispora triticiradicis]GLW22928.1 hypothetical protein Mame01_29710 [Microbispora amethystogenes]
MTSDKEKHMTLKNVLTRLTVFGVLIGGLTLAGTHTAEAVEGGRPIPPGPNGPIIDRDCQRMAGHEARFRWFWNPHTHTWDEVKPNYWMC